jgi:DNA replication protein DnaC
MKTIDFPERHASTAEIHEGEWLAAYQTAKTACEDGRLVIAFGKRGTGKTQMALSIAKTADFPDTQTREGKSRPAIYRKAMDIFLELKATFGKNARTEKEIIDNLVDCAFLVIDEIHVRGESKYEDDKITHIIDKRYDAMRPTMIITNLMRKELVAQLSPSVMSRMEEIGTEIECTWQSFRPQIITPITRPKNSGNPYY